LENAFGAPQDVPSFRLRLGSRPVYSDRLRRTLDCTFPECIHSGQSGVSFAARCRSSCMEAA
jgi:hypothetical protein